MRISKLIMEGIGDVRRREIQELKMSEIGYELCFFTLKNSVKDIVSNSSTLLFNITYIYIWRGCTQASPLLTLR